MAKPLGSDAWWQEVEPLPRLLERAVLVGIIFVLRTGTPWALLPPERGCGSGMTCWRRLHGWHQAVVWDGSPQVLLQCLVAADRLDGHVFTGCVRLAGVARKHVLRRDGAGEHAEHVRAGGRSGPADVEARTRERLDEYHDVEKRSEDDPAGQQASGQRAGSQPNRVWVRVLDAGKPREKTRATQPKWLAASSMERERAGRCKRRPMTSAISRVGTPSSATP